MIPARELKAAIRTAILALPRAPEGFGFDDLSGRMGEACRADGDVRGRLRRWIKNHNDSDLLVSLGRGRYAAGPALEADDALGLSAQLVLDIRQAFDDAGGVLSFRDLLAELDRKDGTLVRRVLNDCDLYSSGTPIPGYRKAWFLVDAERERVPVPGRLMAFDIQMAAGGPRRDLPALLSQRRAEIADALTEARAGAGMTIADVVSTTAVANALDAALRVCEAHRYRQDGAQESIAVWWAQTIGEDGHPVALAKALTDMGRGSAELLGATTVRLWRVLAKILGCSAARLSRGLVVTT